MNGETFPLRPNLSAIEVFHLCVKLKKTSAPKKRSEEEKENRGNLHT